MGLHVHDGQVQAARQGGREREPLGRPEADRFLSRACLPPSRSHVPTRAKPQENAPPDSSMSNGPPTHGGAIALRANPRSVATPRPILTNRRVSTSSPAKPRPPPLPTLPIPYSSAESALPSSPLRGLPSAARRGIQQQQMMNPSGMTRCPSGSGTGGGGQDYAEMLQRAEMMQVQNQRQQMYDGAAATYESGYGSVSRLPFLSTPGTDSHS